MILSRLAAPCINTVILSLSGLTLNFTSFQNSSFDWLCKDSSCWVFQKLPELHFPLFPPLLHWFYSLVWIFSTWGTGRLVLWQVSFSPPTFLWSLRPLQRMARDLTAVLHCLAVWWWNTHGNVPTLSTLSDNDPYQTRSSGHQILWRTWQIHPVHIQIKIKIQYNFPPEINSP